MQAFKHARELVMAEHPMSIMMHSLAHRAFVNNDLAGALLFYSFLSELGSSIAARNAADLWTLHDQKPSIFSPGIPCVGGTARTPASECALFYIKRAAALGDMEAMSLASAAERAKGNDDAAYAWANYAAELGDHRGRFERAMMLGFGTKVLRANTSSALTELWKLRADATDTSDYTDAWVALIGILRIQAWEVLGREGQVTVAAAIITFAAGLLIFFLRLFL